jgi:hypothetical protein
MEEISIGRFILLLFHFLGVGLIVCIQVASFILDAQYRKAPDLQTKAIILRAAKPIGMLSPVAIVVMLITGIGNMHILGLGLFTLGWLTAKIIIFAIAVVNGILTGVKASKRGALVASMVKGDAPSDANELLTSYDNQMRWSQVVNPLLLLLLLGLAIYGRLGGQ